MPKSITGRREGRPDYSKIYHRVAISDYRTGQESYVIKGYLYLLGQTWDIKSFHIEKTTYIKGILITAGANVLLDTYIMVNNEYVAFKYGWGKVEYYFPAAIRIEEDSTLKVYVANWGSVNVFVDILIEGHTEI